MTDSLVVAGEALIDVVAAPDGTLVGHPGGGPYTVARSIGRLEQPVSYLGRISTDGFGARLRHELEDDGVGLDAIVATDAPPRSRSSSWTPREPPRTASTSGARRPRA